MVNEVYVGVFSKEVAHLLLLFWVVFCAHVRRDIVRGGGVHLDILFVRDIWGCECSSKRRHQGSGRARRPQTITCCRTLWMYAPVYFGHLWPLERSLPLLPCLAPYNTGPNKAPPSRAFTLSGAISLSMLSSHLHLFPPSALKSFCDPPFGRSPRLCVAPVLVNSWDASSTPHQGQIPGFEDLDPRESHRSRARAQENWDLKPYLRLCAWSYATYPSSIP